VRRVGLVVGRAAASCLLAALPLAGTACNKTAASNEKAGRGVGGAPVPVTVAKAELRIVPQELSAIGTVMASSTVSIRAEVTGVLMKVHFRKGQNVNQGDVLFTIDPRPFEATLKQAQATLARDKFLSRNAHIELKREADLLEKKISSQSDYDKRQADADAIDAQAQADEAAVDNARLQVEHCTIASPLSGRTGDLLVDQGNLVKSGDQALVCIAEVRPIRVSFAIPQGVLPAVKKAMTAGKLGVRALLPREESDPETGELTFVDNSVDKTTGTIQLQATFPNERERLWPGLFVNVSLVLSTDPDAIVVPAKAVQNGQKGKYVFVVGADGNAEYRAVTIRQSTADIAVVAKGVERGETVITDGHLRVLQGKPVVIKTSLKGESASEKATSSPASAPSEDKPSGPVTAERGGRP
jgi:membrane fusion protein, multidrug efflux system